jgi:phenylalanyl-tRNA synthetase beta chain
MKISVNLIRFLNSRYKSAADPATNGVDELVAKIGSQLGEIEGVVDLTLKYQGVVVVKVVSCADHPNADRLHVCKIDDAGKTENVARDKKGHIQVVCGAPNVREGLTVAWLPPGSTVPESYGKEPFVLEARVIRGAVSNGMLASPKELALGGGHDGILELDDDKPAGTSFAEAYGLNDHIIDIENKMFTHRPDCFGYLGIAREIAGIQGQPYRSPDWYKQDADIPAIEAEVLQLAVQNELPSLVPRFCAIAMRGVEIKPSPVWLQVELAKVGVRSINNIVDYTNFFMLETGQPLHAYDYDKVKALSDGNEATIVIRNPLENEQITLLNGKTIDPRQEAIMIATNKQLIGVGGVMGGGETEVDENTKNIILEVATFDMYSVRRTSMEHGLFTDAVTRFSKGQSPLQNRAVLAKIVDEIRQHAGGKIASELIDVNQVVGREWVHLPVPVTSSFINARLGLELSPEQMKTLLENVEFSITVDDDKLTLAAPFWRTDVETREDVVEEVGRLYGFDKLPLVLPEKSIAPAAKDPTLELKRAVRENLVKSGANELLTYSFVHGNLLEKVGQNVDLAFKLSNALSPDLQYFRMSLLPSLLDKVHANVKSGYDEFALFEMGKSHSIKHQDNDDGLPTEFEILAFVYTASSKLKKGGAAYYVAHNYLQNLAIHLGVELVFTPIDTMPDEPIVKPYEQGRSAFVYLKSNDKFLGIIGELTAGTRKNLKLSDQTAAFEIDLEELERNRTLLGRYEALPRFPKVIQDITLKVTTAIAYQTVLQCVGEAVEAAKPRQSISKLLPLSIYQKLDDADHKQVTLRLSIASYEKTMTDNEVTIVLDAVAVACKEKLGAERI